MDKKTQTPDSEFVAEGKWNSTPRNRLRDQYDWLPTLPTALLQYLKEADDVRLKRRSPQLFTDETYALEEEMAEAVEKVPFGVGIRFDEIVTAPALCSVDASAKVNDQQRREIVAYCREEGVNTLAIEEHLRMLDQLKLANAVAQAAHGGFLMSQPQFHDEYRDLKSAIIEKMLLLRRYVDAMSIVQVGSHAEQSLQIDLQQSFLNNWGIRSMKAPYVFEFDGPLLGFTADVIATLRPKAVVQAWPPSMPAPTRQTAKDAMSTGSDTDRLAEFQSLMKSPGSTQRLIWLGQLYRVQHYWRALAERYGDRLEGNRNRFLSPIVQFVTGNTSEPGANALHRLDSALKRVESLTKSSPGN